MLAAFALMPALVPERTELRAQVDYAASVDVVVTESETAHTPLGWRVDSEPDLVIGAGESLDGLLFDVQGVRAMPDSTILVVDGGSAELRFFDGHGERTAVSGGEGRGPGEFLAPVLVPSPGQDSLVLFDRRLGRFQVFLSGGSFVRTITAGPDGWPQRARPPIGIVSEQALFRRVDGLERALASGPGLKTLTYTYYWYDIGSYRRRQLTSFSRRWQYSDAWGTGPLPFSATPSAAVLPTGALVTDGARPEILEFDLSGELRRVFRVDGRRRPVTPDMIESAIDQEARSLPQVSRGQVARRFDDMPLPDSLPPVVSLIADPAGYVWAKRFSPDPARDNEWVVYDLSSGRALGTVGTPPGLDVRYIGRDFVLGLWKDEFDVEYVRRHPLARSLLHEG
jgi:hypothetical protein